MGRVPVADVWGKYQDWCREEGVQALSRIQMSHEMEKKGHKKKVMKWNNSSTRCFENVGLKCENYHEEI